MESGMTALAKIDLAPGDFAMLSGGALYVYGPEPDARPDSEQSHEALGERSEARDRMPA